MKYKEDLITEPLDKAPVPIGLAPTISSFPGLAGGLSRERAQAREDSLLIVNADDWGQSQETTDRALDCVVRGTVSSVSAMVFMHDSERAAAIAVERGIDAGLHLNFTTMFSAPNSHGQLAEHQAEIAKYLLRRRMNQVVFHPGLLRPFEYVAKTQLDEFLRLYKTPPDRIDGHHHMHLCMNVLLARLLPAGTIARRSFSFQPGEKNWVNRLYRQALDRGLARRHRLTDFFFSLPPLEPPSRLQRIFSLAKQFTVEVETHPARSEEYRFLTGNEIHRLTTNIRVASLRQISPCRPKSWNAKEPE